LVLIDSEETWVFMGIQDIHMVLVVRGNASATYIHYMNVMNDSLSLMAYTTSRVDAQGSFLVWEISFGYFLVECFILLHTASIKYK
jgi:hypothetical protein